MKSIEEQRRNLEASRAKLRKIISQQAPRKHTRNLEASAADQPQHEESTHDLPVR